MLLPLIKRAGKNKRLKLYHFNVKDVVGKLTASFSDVERNFLYVDWLRK